MRRLAPLTRPIAGTALLMAGIALFAYAPTTGAAPRASLPSIERQVMCVTCKIPLNEAQSPQADRERAFIRSLTEEGRSEREIKDALVGQYGSTVLALPRARGFALAVYLVPALVVLVLVVLLATLLPSWRRRARAQQGAPAGTAPLGALNPDDAARLDADLARFD
jgi:cytochrome c-type biogenesis protein CcmH